MMKSIRLFLTIALLTMVGNASADGLTTSDFSIAPGETKTLSIALENPTNDYIACEFWMRLPDGVRIVYDEEGYLMATLNSGRAPRHELEVKEPEGDGVYHFLCYSNRNTTFKDKSGEFISITLKCADGAMAGSYSGLMYDLIFSDPYKVQVNLPDISFGITIADRTLLGDANGDSNVTIADVVAVVNYITTNGSSTGTFFPRAADVDGVNGITIADAISIVNIVLGK